MFGGKPDKETQAPNLVRAPKELVAQYANIDTSNALLIWQKQQEELYLEDLMPVHEMEMDLLKVVVEMERGGVRVDVDKAAVAIGQLKKEIRKSQKALDRLVGKPINVNSAPQVKVLMGVHKDDNGQWRTKDGVLLEPTESGNSGSLKTEKLYQSQLPEARLIAEIRAMMKAQGMLETHVIGSNHKGYVHASINQTRTEEGDGTYTGRFSITDPALQQIHKRNKKMAAIVRACFIPDEGCEWGCFDWSQKDFRVFAHYVNDPAINAIFANNPAADFHTLVADITGLPRDRDQKTGGANAKQVNLAMVFGMSAGRLAKECFLPYTVQGFCRTCRTNVTRNPCPGCGIEVKLWFKPGPEADELFGKYHAKIPGANRLKESVKSVAESRGYIKTQMGRRLRFPNGRGAYKAAGILFQSQAAESMKWKIVEVNKYIQAYPEIGRLMLVVHDEFDFSLRMARDRKHDAEIKRILETFDGISSPLKYRVPILSDYGVGPSWWEASK